VSATAQRCKYSAFCTRLCSTDSNHKPRHTPDLPARYSSEGDIVSVIRIRRVKDVFLLSLSCSAQVFFVPDIEKSLLLRKHRPLQLLGTRGRLTSYPSSISMFGRFMACQRCVISIICKRQVHDLKIVAGSEEKVSRFAPSKTCSLQGRA
jgi:hypothetical protein